MLSEAKKVAAAAGKERVTAKSVKQAQAPAPSVLSAHVSGILSSLGVGPAAPLAPTARGGKLPLTQARFDMFLETLQEVLEMTELALIHETVRDALTFDPDTRQRIQAA